MSSLIFSNHSSTHSLYRDHKGSVIGGALRNVLNAQKLIEWLLEEKDIVSRDEGVALGRQFVALGVLRHGQPLSLDLSDCGSTVCVIHFLSTSFILVLIVTTMQHLQIVRHHVIEGGLPLVQLPYIID